jgi:hypothetical protein
MSRHTLTLGGQWEVDEIVAGGRLEAKSGEPLTDKKSLFWSCGHWPAWTA